MNKLINNKIFFYSNHREDDSSIGITKKVRSQIATFREMGYQVYYSAYINKGIGIFNNEDKLVKYKKCIRFDGGLGHLLRRTINLRLSAKYIKENEFGIGYYRFHFWDPFFVSLVKANKKYGGKVCVEAHSYPYKSHKELPMKVIYVLDELFDKYAVKYVDLVAAITDKELEIWGCKTIIIQNGINIDDCLVRTVKTKNQDSINIVCVANEVASHGIPRLIRGLGKYYKDDKKKPTVKVWMIGEYLRPTKNLVNNLNLQDYVIFVGKKHGQELYEYYDRAHIGVGPLATYITDYHQGECLKTKEYIAVGLPFFTYASKDAKLNQEPYALVFSDRDTPIDINRIVEYCKSNEMSQKDAEELHHYAKMHYIWEIQLEKVLKEFISKA